MIIGCSLRQNLYSKKITSREGLKIIRAHFYPITTACVKNVTNLILNNFYKLEPIFLHIALLESFYYNYTYVSLLNLL